MEELAIQGAYVFVPQQHADERGTFWEWYRYDLLAEAVGHPLDLRQGNASISKKGVVRGIHFADLPRGQAKYVSVARGAVIDFVVDLRIGSPTFGTWDSVVLDTADRRAVYIGEGLGHAFVALEDDAMVSYLVSDTYRPEREHGINPLDPAIGLEYPEWLADPIVSQKDRAAPTLAEAVERGILPRFDEVASLAERLDADWRLL